MTKIIRMKHGLAVGAAILAWGTAFGAAELFNVRAFGAKGDGVTKDTAAIQKALDAAAGKGGRVVVPSGTYLTGTIWLKDRTELHLEKGAVLLGSPDLADYNAEDAFEQNWRSPGEGWSGKHLVIAHEVTDVAITGEGTIDGNGARFLDANIPPDPVRKTRMAYRLGYSNLKDRKTMARPGQEVAFYECRGVRIEGVTLRNMAMWTCFLHGCDDIAIKGVTIRNDLRFANTDGFDVDACRRVTITDCDIETADDAFAIRCCPRLLKSKRGVCEDIRIDNCKVRTECEVVRIGVGDGLVRNVRISNLDVSDAGRGFVVQSIYPGSKYKGLGIEDVVISDCTLRKVVQAIAVTAGTPNAQSSLKDVTFERVSANLEGGVMVNGLGRTRPANIRFKDVRLRAVKGDFVLGHDWEVGKMDNDPRNVIRVERADGVTLEGVTVENGEGVERPRLATRDVTGLVDGAAAAFIGANPPLAQDADMDNVLRTKCDTLVVAKEVPNAKQVKRAVWRSTALGVYEAYVNGAAMTEQALKPGYTNTQRRRLAYDWDVTKLMRTGAGERNVFAARVTSGWWRDQIVGWGRRQANGAFQGTLKLEYADGSSEEIVTDGSWKAAYAGKVTHAAIYYGETYDNRVKEDFLTDAAAFAGWKNAVPCDEFKGEVASDPSSGICRREDLAMKPAEAYVWKDATGAEGTNAFGRVVRLRTFKDGEAMSVRAGEKLVVDFGQNAAAAPEFVFRAKRGTALTARFGEMLNDANGERSRGNDGPGGSVYLANMRSCPSRLDYVFSGEGEERYAPQFSFWGYRYLTLEATDDVEILSLMSVPVTSVLREQERGTLTTGDARINRLVANARWGMLSNYLSVPTDCPQRDERQGWTADTQVFVPTALYFADVNGFLKKWMDDVFDSQAKDGSLPCVAPLGNGQDQKWGQPRIGWSDAAIIVPHRMWLMSGDTRVLERHWTGMTRYMDRIAADGYATATNDFQFADWLSFEKWESSSGRAWDIKEGKYRTEAMRWWNYLGGCYLLWDARMMEEMAGTLGKPDDAARFARLAADALVRLRREFLPDGDLVKDFRDMQTANLFALKLGLAPDAAAKGVIRDRLVGLIRDNGDRLATGFLGTSILMDTLTFDADASGLAYDLLFQRKCPSWLYSVDQGATTIWERWNSYVKDAGFGPVWMNSFNHYAYGAVVAWIYGTAAGIRPDPAHPGFRRFVLAPIPDRRFGHVDARYESAAGLIVSKWRFADDKWVWEFAVPEGAAASVTLPDGTAAKEYGPGEHRVELSAKSVELRFAPHPVTQAEWQRITGENHSRVKNPDAPVDHVAYQDVVEKFLPKYRRATRRRWDLPTEAERRLSKLPFEGVREWTKDLWNPADKKGEPIMVILEDDKRSASYAGSITGTDHDGVRLIDRGPLYALPVVPEVTDYAVEAGAEEFVFAGAADEKVDPQLDVASDEGYVLTLAKAGSTLVAKGERGLLWGRETLKQLRGVTVREGVVRDQPKYRIRGAMLDVGRKYYPMTFLDRIVDELARYKMNEFHVHLNDDGGGYAAFRLESETYPGLTAKDGSYTKDEFRAFMKRAAAKGVTVVPEIDAPAHSLCFTKYRSEFASKQYGKNHLDLKAPGLMEFFDKLYGEYLDGDDPVFAGPYLHVGTDEYDKKAAEDFRAFTDAAFRLVRKHGKEPRAWGALTHARGKTPVLSDGIIMDIWHNSYFEPYEALAQGYRIVSVPDMWVYIVPNTGYYYDYLDLEGLWNEWEPNVIGRVTVPANHPGLMGGKFALWNDKLGKAVTLQGTWDRMAPAICALSDKMWKGTCETRSKPLLPESFPFVVSYDAPDNVVSMRHLLDAPAGKDGHVFVKDGNFHTAKGKIRFNATNLTGPANFPSKDYADRMADRMARFGLNCVRLHFLDAPYGYGTFMLPLQKCLLEDKDSRTEWTIDPKQFDRLDYLVAALKKRGIYVNINLHVSRLGGSGIAAAKTSCKGSTWFARELVESEKRYAKDLLTHRNPYTGMTYTEDPAVAMVELNNEDALFSSFQAAVRTGKELPYLDELKKLWGRDWEVTTNRVSEAFLTFLLDTERAYLKEMKAYLKDELKVRAPLASTQLTYSPVWSQQELDYLDTHEYWCHPSPVNKGWRVRQDPMVNAPEGNCVAWNTPRKTTVHPMTMSEYNNPYPNYYGAEGQPLMHAYAAFQDWDGVFEYSYDNRVDSEPDSVEYFFSMVARTDVLAHLPACAAMFLRGDVKVARRFVTVPTAEANWTKDAAAKWNESVGKVTPFDDASHATGGKLPYREGLLTGIRMDLTGTANPVDFDALPKPKDGVYLSDTGELRWDVSLKDRGYFTCVTPNVRLFTGFVAGRTFDLGGIALRIGRTANDWATVSFTSQRGNGMDGKKDVSRILLAATGRTLNTGADPENRVWGTGPVRTEGVPAEITLPVSAKAVRVWALDERGERRAPVRVVPSAKAASFRIGPEFRTVWYEIEVDAR